MLTFETGIAVGQALEQIKRHDSEIGSIRKDLEEVKEDLGKTKSLVLRGGLLLALWVAGFAGHMNAETVGEAIGHTIKALRK